MVTVKKCLLYFLIPLSFFFVSCRGERLLFISDPYWDKIFFTQKEITRMAPQRITVLHVLTQGEELSDPQKAAEIIGGFKGNVVVLTPYYAEYASNLAKTYPKKNFFLLSFHDGAENSENVQYSQVFLSRKAAFLEAGRAMCGYLTNHPETKTAGVWDIRNPERKEEYQVFMNAFSEKCAPERFSVILIDDNEKQEQKEDHFLESFIEETDLNAGPVLGIALMPGYNHRLVGNFFDFSIPFLTEYVDNEDYLSGNLHFSVEYPLREVLSSIVETAKEGKKNAKVEAVFRKRE